MKKMFYFIVLLLTSIIIHYALREGGRNTISNNFSKLNINGIVVKKYIDYDDHYARIIIVKNFSGEVERVDLTLVQNDLYNLINIRDTLIKDSATNKILIRRFEFDTILNFEWYNW